MANGPVLWAKLSWPEIEDLVRRGPRMAIWPLGTTEEHGRHLPVDVDLANCWEVARGVSANTGVPLIPPLPYGDSGFWRGWPGTLSLSAESFIAVVGDVCAGLYESGIRKILLLNGHLGNVPALRIASRKVQARHPDAQVRALSWWDVSPRVIEVMYADSITGASRSFHGNDGETSVYLTHSPELVHLDLAVDEPDRSRPQPFFTYGSQQITGSGAIGHPTSASVDKGREVLRWAIEDLTAEVRRAIEEIAPGVRS
ncbi:MAG TPA: creatininase family protein [Nitrolancea sp.]|nr:creatininase family protein [Nitrolancea sp.]